MAGGPSWPCQRTATRLVERLTRADSTPARPPSAFSMVWMQPPQWMAGTDRSVCLMPPGRSRLASRNSSSEGPRRTGPATASTNSGGGRQQLMDLVPHRRVGVPGGMAEQREDDDEPD